MRILFLSELFWPYIGGVETLSADMLPRLSERGFDFQVVATHSYMDLPDEDLLSGIPIRRFPFRSVVESRDPEGLVRVRTEFSDLVRDFDPDLVHFFGRGIGMLFYRSVVTKTPIPTLITLQNKIRGAGTESPDTALQATLRSSAWVVACSRDVLNQVRAAVPEIGPRSSVIYNAIAPPPFDPPPPSLDPPVLMCVGRLTRQKGFDLAIRAFALISGRYERARLVLVGDGDQREALEDLADRLGVGDRVEFLGMVAPDRVLTLLGDTSMVLMPSRWEGLPVVAVQAAMMERPIVGTDVCGLGEVNIHGETGLVVEKESPESLADGISTLLDDPAKARSLGRAGRVRALSMFTLDRTLNAYDGLYRQLGPVSVHREA